MMQIQNTRTCEGLVFSIILGCDIVPRCKQLRVQEKECEAEKDRLALEEVKNCLLNIRREGGTSGQKVTGKFFLL